MVQSLGKSHKTLDGSFLIVICFALKRKCIVSRSIHWESLLVTSYHLSGEREISSYFCASHVERQRAECVVTVLSKLMNWRTSNRKNVRPSRFLVRFRLRWHKLISVNCMSMGRETKLDDIWIFHLPIC